MRQSQHESVPVARDTGGRILIVDDDAALSYALARLLAVEGYEVAHAYDYRDALRILEDGSPVALLLTDLLIPVVNGFALARMARMRHRDLKIVYMTGFADFPATEAHGPVLHKPIDQDMLLRMVHETLPAA